MEKLQVLIYTTITLLALFIIALIWSVIKGTRKSLFISIATLLVFVGTAIYTAQYWFFLGVDAVIRVAQKIFPPFDSDVADTESNKKNFQNFLNVDLTPDIKNIYCFGDALGQNADYMFSFTCDSTTAQNIIEENELVKDSTIGNNPESLQHDFVWWDKQRLSQLQSYSWNSNLETKNRHKLFWYDDRNQKGYYFEYEL